METRAGDSATLPTACSAWTRKDHPRCESCGYDLRGSPEPRCPECGAAYEPRCPDCAGRGQQVRLPHRGRLAVLLAIVLLLTVLILLGVMTTGWTTVIAAVAVPGILLFYAALAQAVPSQCDRCRGTGIDFEDRVWTGPKG